MQKLLHINLLNYGMLKFSTHFSLMLIAAMACTIPSAHAASFDCGAAKSEMEKAICSDPQLSALDEELNAVFKAAIDHSPNRSALRDSQRKWLRSYELKSCREISCWRIRLLERINILKSELGSHGYALPPLADYSEKVDTRSSESNPSNHAGARDRLPQASFAEPVSATAVAVQDRAWSGPSNAPGECWISIPPHELPPGYNCENLTPGIALKSSKIRVFYRQRYADNGELFTKLFATRIVLEEFISILSRGRTRGEAVERAMEMLAKQSEETRTSWHYSGNVVYNRAIGNSPMGGVNCVVGQEWEPTADGFRFYLSSWSKDCNNSYFASLKREIDDNRMKGGGTGTDVYLLRRY